MPDYEPPDDALFEWADIVGLLSEPGLLVGNGASIAVGPGFRYPSLLTRASAEDLDHPLTDENLAVFEALETTDFEQVLRSLEIAKLVCGQAGHETDTHARRYGAIRHALLEAIRAVHPQHSALHFALLPCYQGELTAFSAIFTTNYDLLLYWAIVQPERRRSFVDYFWNENLSFSRTNCEVWGDQIPVLYLHGALFIHELPDGTTVKASGERSSGSYEPLLTLDFDYQDSGLPLFVSEGHSAQKMRAIRGSDYLSFAYGEFVDFIDDLVIYGHSLSRQDAHLVEAINSSNNAANRRRIAVGIHRENPDQVSVEKERYAGIVDCAQILFFNARSFPLANCLRRRWGTVD